MRNIQKKVSHRNRFYKSPQTQRNNPSQTKFSSIFCQMQTNIKILNAYVELDNLVIFVDKDDVLDTIITLKNYSFDILSDMFLNSKFEAAARKIDPKKLFVFS